MRRFVPESGACCRVGGAPLEEPAWSDAWPVLYAPSQGLVSGDISSKSRSAGEGRYGLCMFWKTMFAGAECGAGGIICCDIYDCCPCPWMF